jgi:FMN phosphatase YigB (HAD superfamily)
MARRNLLLCFDAFGTLFHPKSPVAEQYATVARQCGLEGFTTKDVQASFKTAFSSESKAHPNYGKASGMGAPKWWTNVSIMALASLIIMTVTNIPLRTR